MAGLNKIYLKFNSLMCLLVVSITSYGYYGESCGFKTFLANPASSNQKINNKQYYFADEHNGDTIKPIELKYNITEQKYDSYIVKQYEPIQHSESEHPKLPIIGVWMQFSTDFLIKGLKRVGEPYIGEKLPKYMPAAWLYWVGNNTNLMQEYSQPRAHILEPINFLFLIKAKELVKANNKINSILSQAKYSTGGDSTNGYSGLFSNSNPNSMEYIDQLPGTYTSGLDSSLPHIHFRLLGPYNSKNSEWYIYSASVSEESPFYQRIVKDSGNQNGFDCGHMYVSLTSAKNSLVYSLLKTIKPSPINKGLAKIKGIYSINLHNTIPLKKDYRSIDNKEISDQIYYYTGDHQLNRSTASGYSFIAIIQ